MRAFGLALLALLGACYSPSYEGLACGAGSGCPDGYRCSAQSRCTLEPDGPGPGPGGDSIPPVTTLTARPPEFDTEVRPTFEFSCDEVDCTFQCRLDSTVFEPCVGSYLPPELPEGEHTFEVAATDAAGNQESPPLFVRWNVDLTPPTVSLASKPAPISGSTVSFTFEANEPVTGYACNLQPTDAEGFAACTSPLEYTALADGEYSFRVRTTDRAGRVGELAAPHTWTVDASAFTASIAGPPPLSEKTVTFAISSNRPGATFQCSLDPAGPPVYADCDSPVTFTNLAEGPHTFYARAESPADVFSNPASLTWTVDATGPTVTVNGIGQGTWSNRETLDFTLSCNEPPCTFECRRDGSAFGPAPNGVCSIGSLGNGAHSIEARATDGRRNVGGSVARGWHTDRTPPGATVADPWDGGVHCNSSPTLSIDYAAFDNESGLFWYQCRLVRGETVVFDNQCQQPNNITVTALVQGEDYSFTMTATDMAGNSRADGLTWIQRNALACSQM